MNEHLFPRFHVRPPGGYLNDPNGPVVVDGLLHLYFQHRTDVDLDAAVTWGHATTSDLVHWRYHPPALVPDPRLGDRDGCWSGNTVLDDDGLVRAYYSGFVRGESLQRTLVAASADGGWTFGPAHETVPPPLVEERVTSLRDPFVWRQAGSWQMVLGAGTADGTAMVRRYASDDLETWTYLGPLARMARTRTAAWDSGVMWECPQVLALDGDPVVLFGSCAPAEGVMHALSLRWRDVPDGADIDPSALHRLDHGPNFYAPSVLDHPELGAMVWGWATEGRSLDWCRDDGWSGVLTLPRLVTHHDAGGLASAPPPGLDALRVPGSGRALVDDLSGLGAQLELELVVGRSSVPSVLSLQFGASEHLDVVVDAEARSVVVDRDHASADVRADRGRFVVDEVDLHPGAVLRGFVDGSILELFLPGGRVLTTRFYPTSPPPWRAELGPGSAARVTVWQLVGSDPVV